MRDLHIVYLSQLAPTHDYRVVGDICRTARSRNVGLGIAGVLVFDGQRFCQWLYGPQEPVRRLMATIARDPRHADVSVRFEAMRPAPDGVRCWRAGFVGPTALDALAALPPDAGAAVLEAVAGLVAQADLEPPLAVAVPSRAPPQRGEDGVG